MSLQDLKVRVDFLGCRTNAAEAEALSSAFLRLGSVITRGSDWDVVILVTCSVTAVADRKTRQLLSRLRRENPDGMVVACGCWAQGADEEQARALGLDLLVGNRQKSKIPELVEAHRHSQELSFYRQQRLATRQWDSLTLDEPLRHSRAFIKVQDGCDYRCSYCIVPSLRGPSVSRPLDDVLQEVRRVVDSHCVEVVLTGVHLGLYGGDNGSSLARLIESVGAVQGLSRLRLGSLEPISISDQLMAVMTQTKTFCPHLHLPVQSGSNAVLSAMRRGHSREEFIDMTDRLRSFLGADLHISTDVMVAFPGEEEQDFEDTLDLLRRCRIGRIHGFVYSPRAGTPAAARNDQVPPAVAARRLERLKTLSAQAIEQEALQWLGHRVEVLAERRGRGYSRHYIEAQLPQGAPRGEEIQLYVSGVKGGVLQSG